MKLSAVLLANFAKSEYVPWVTMGHLDDPSHDPNENGEFMHGKYQYNPKCIGRLRHSAQACVTAVLQKYEDTGKTDESILDNIMNCPCMERCFNGAPCRMTGDFAEFGMRNTHQDYYSPVDASPVLADGVTLDKPVMLFWSDEFEGPDSGPLALNQYVDGEQWRRHNQEDGDRNQNAKVSDGKMTLLFRDDLSSNSFPGYSGAKVTSKWTKVASSEFTQAMPKFGYYEAKIQVPSDRKGRACKMKLVPNWRGNLATGARIDILNNGVTADNEFKTNVVKGTGNNEQRKPMTHTVDAPLHDEPHVYGLYWTPEKLEWYFDGELVRSEEDSNLIPTDVPLYWQFEAQLLDINGGPDAATEWPASCDVEYVRHFALDDVNEACLPKDKAEQAKCEKMYQDQNLSATDTATKIAQNCPCHIHCYNGCVNCGTYECADSSLVDKNTPACTKPLRLDGHGQDGNFALEYSDEFEGEFLNTNRWVAVEKGQSGRKDNNNNEFQWRKSQNGVSGDGYLVQTVEKVKDTDSNGNEIDRYISGRISTAGLLSPIYGFYEARLDTLPVEGMQSAWWLWAENGKWNYEWNTPENKPSWMTEKCVDRYKPGTGNNSWQASCTKVNDEHHNPYGLTYPAMVTFECPVQKGTSNAWWGTEIDIIEARAKDDIMSTNIHGGGYKGGGAAGGCYFSGHKDIQREGLHIGFHTFGLRWKKDLLEWYYDGELVRTEDRPDYVSRGAGFFILSQGLFGSGWFVEGEIEKYEAEFGLPVQHKVDYVRFWKEVDEEVPCPGTTPIPPCPPTHRNDGALFEFHYAQRKPFNDAVEYCAGLGDGWAIPNPANAEENQAIVDSAIAKYVSTNQDIWINVLHRDGKWGLNDGYSNWASPEKAEDPDQYGDGALIKTGTKSAPNGKWKQLFSQKTNGANRGRTLCVKKLDPPTTISTGGCTTNPPTITPPVINCHEDGHPDDCNTDIPTKSPIDLPMGGCLDSGSDLKTCAKQCDGENYGRAMISRQMYSKNFWAYKVVAGNAREYAKKNNRYMLRMDESHCPIEILNLIVANKIQFDAMDATEDLMTFEASFANFDESLDGFNPDCRENRRGLYLQFFRNRDILENGDKDFMNNNETKDWFYWVVNNIAGLQDLGVDETALNRCIKSSKVGLIKTPENETDYTKCWAYDTCRIDPDW